MAECDLPTLIDQACENKFTCLDDERIARGVILQLLCNLVDSGGGGVAWGAITGLLADQADLQAALDAKANLSTTKVYRALVTQSGVADPTVVVLENTVGAIVWTRSGGGDYRATLAGAFVQSKTFLMCNAGSSSSTLVALSNVLGLRWIDVNSLSLYDVNGSDGEPLSTPVEILVYP